MKSWFGLPALALLLAVTSPPAATQAPLGRPTRPGDATLPNGKSQAEAILKADHEKDLKDAAQLVELSEQLKEELEKNDRHVLSVSSLKKTEEIEKIAKRIRSRLRRF
ncbi:MAG TPA: hypothetical protein VFA33_12890 [Bryobacteraceae bacterium]|nr:hypothetical protein [Bryobacteraceae bacterium]